MYGFKNKISTDHEKNIQNPQFLRKLQHFVNSTEF